MSRFPSPACVALCALACTPVASGATVWHANPDVAGSVQGAADLAAPGDTVLLDPGTYFEHVTVAGKSLVFLGEAGAAETTLDGSSAGRILTLENSGGTVAVAGLTFQNGALAGLEASDGAAIAARNAGLRAEDCVFVGNRLLTPGRGGAVFTSFFAPAAGPGPTPVGLALEMIRCRFENNSAGDEGGAVYVDNVPSNFTACVFTGNEAVVGGAISILGGSHILQQCRFEENHAALHAGAFMSSGDGSLSLTEVLFRGNSAEDFGGALRAVNGPDLRLDRTWFVDNTALRGAGLDASATPVHADHVLFYGGQAGEQAGGAYVDNATAAFTRCSWLDNSAPDGASLVARSSDLAVDHSLLEDDDPQATECPAGTQVVAGCNAGAPGTGGCVEVAARLTVRGCPSQPEALCTVPEFDSCGVVGHADVVCAPGACTTPVLPITWGRLKTAYR